MDNYRKIIKKIYRVTIKVYIIIQIVQCNGKARDISDEYCLLNCATTFLSVQLFSILKIFKSLSCCFMREIVLLDFFQITIGQFPPFEISISRRPKSKLGGGYKSKMDLIAGYGSDDDSSDEERSIVKTNNNAKSSM